MSDDVTEAIEREAELLVRIEAAERINEKLRELNAKGRALFSQGDIRGAKKVLREANKLIVELMTFEQQYEDPEHG